MRRELIDALQKDYPELFKDLWGDPRKTCMAFGVEIGDGWEPILRELCAGIKAAGSGGCVFMQVKEKFGQLRVYWSGYNCGRDLCYEIEKLVDAAEEKSITVCEGCGGPGKLCVNNGWLRTTCDPNGGHCIAQVKST